MKFIIVFVCFGYYCCLSSQDITPNHVISNTFHLDSIFQIETISGKSSVAKSFNLKCHNNLIYLLGEDYINNSDAVLFRINTNTTTRDTFHLNFKENTFFFQSILDFDVLNDKLILMYNSELFIYDLLTRQYIKKSLAKEKKNKYKHFEIKDSNSIYLYEWRIGDRITEEKNVFTYNYFTDEYKTIEKYSLDGLHFIATASEKKYIDINKDQLVFFHPNEYILYFKNLKTGKCDTIIRILDSTNFIEREKLNKLNFAYLKSPSFAILDSLTQYESEKTQISSINLTGDSIIYVIYQNIVSNSCQYLKSNTLEYLDVWAFDKFNKIWYLKKKNIRLDNLLYCKKTFYKEAKKDGLMFSSVDKWEVMDNKLIFLKYYSYKIDINGDISGIYLKDYIYDNKLLYVFVYLLN